MLHFSLLVIGQVDGGEGWIALREMSFSSGGLHGRDGRRLWLGQQLHSSLFED